ncbi:MAG: hypothetical protein WCR42_03200 [bacterium]
MSKKYLYSVGELVNADYIAAKAGITAKSVYKKKGLEIYKSDKTIPSPTGKGRPVQLYNIEALSLYNIAPQKFQADDMQKNSITRKKREDVGKPRSMSQELWEYGVKLIKEAYINHPVRDCRLICERVCAQLQQNGYPDADADKFYKSIMRKEPKRGKYGVFFADSQNWEVLRQCNMQNSKFALNSGTTRYDIFSIMMTGGLAGKGYGACRIIVIDDFERDVAVNHNGTPTKPQGLAYIDGLTGFPLYYMGTEDITTASVARGILTVAYHYGLYDDTIWIIENSHVMKNVNINGLINTLYSPEQLEKFKDYKWITALYHQPPMPIIHNPPHIPRHVSKAKIESQFNRVKREFDAIYAPLQFTGGNRSESVTLTRARMPYYASKNLDKLPEHLKLVPLVDYWLDFKYWMYDDPVLAYIDRPRPKFSKIARSLGIKNTLREMFSYFDSPTEREIPSMNIERFSKILFFAQPSRTKQDRLLKLTTKNYSSISCTISTETVNLISEVFVNLIGHRVAVLPIPDDDTHFVVMLADRPDDPEFVGVFKNQYARTFEDADSMRAHARKVRTNLDHQLGKVIEQSKISKPALSPHRDAKKNTVLSPQTPDLLSDGNVGWINNLQDDVVEGQEVNKLSRAIEVQALPVHEENIKPSINLLDQKRNEMLERARASLKGVSYGKR